MPPPSAQYEMRPVFAGLLLDSDSFEGFRLLLFRPLAVGWVLNAALGFDLLSLLRWSDIIGPLYWKLPKKGGQKLATFPSIDDRVEVVPGKRKSIT